MLINLMFLKQKFLYYILHAFRLDLLGKFNTEETLGFKETIISAQWQKIPNN